VAPRRRNYLTGPAVEKQGPLINNLGMSPEGFSARKHGCHFGPGSSHCHTNQFVDHHTNKEHANGDRFEGLEHFLDIVGCLD
jgi:hypothetical protein